KQAFLGSFDRSFLPRRLGGGFKAHDIGARRFEFEAHLRALDGDVQDPTAVLMRPQLALLGSGGEWSDGCAAEGEGEGEAKGEGWGERERGRCGHIAGVPISKPPKHGRAGRGAKRQKNHFSPGAPPRRHWIL